MKVMIAEATKLQLDFLVAKCEGIEMKAIDGNFYYRGEDGVFRYMIGFSFSPSTNWNQAGPIIEREKIDTYSQYPCVGPTIWYGRRKGSTKGVGPTPLVAAMRCYVASKLGDEVDIPEELK